MTPAERAKRYRDRKRREREAAPERKRERRQKRDRDRKRADRAAVKRAATVKSSRPLPTGSDLVSWCSELTVTQGWGEGALIELLPWQVEFLERVEAAAGGEVGLSIGAGAGKTTTAAAVAAAATVGPLARRRASVLLVAATYQQATLAWDHARAFLQPWIDRDPERYRVLRSEQVAVFEDRETGVELRAREAVSRSLQGAAVACIVADEPREWKPSQRAGIYAALRSRLGKIEGSRLVAIGVQPADAEHWFRRLCRRNGMVYAAAGDAPFDDEGTWHQANPSLATMPWLMDVYRREAQEAREDPDELPTFMALRLNVGAGDTATAMFIDANDWEEIECDVQPDRQHGYVMGLDLSGGASLVGVVAYWYRCGRVEAFAAFPPAPSLEEREKQDAVPDRLYQRLHEAGELLLLSDPVTGDQVVPVRAVLREAISRWGYPEVIASDYHERRELHGVMADIGMDPSARHVASSLGWQDSPWRIRSARRAIRAGLVRPPRSLLMRASLSGALVERDKVRQERLIKARGGRGGRIRDDVAAALLQALSEGYERGQRTPRPRRFEWGIAG